MKKYCLSLILFLYFFSSHCQEIDRRLLQNRGKQAEEAFKYNKNGYNYFLFELDSSYTVRKLSELGPEEIKMLKKIEIPTKVIQTIGTDQFNFYDLGIRLNNQSRQYFKIDPFNVLVFHKISEVTESFFKSSMNTK